MVQGDKSAMSFFRRNSLRSPSTDASNSKNFSWFPFRSMRLKGRRNTVAEMVSTEQPSLPLEPTLQREEPSFSYSNSKDLAKDMAFFAHLPSLCDVTFLVGRDKKPVCAVKAILAARSRVFREMLFGGGSLKQKAKTKRYKSNKMTELLDFKGGYKVFLEEFDYDVFKQVIEYAHTGSVTMQARTLIGLVNAADHFAMPDLVAACMKFLDEMISSDSVCIMLSNAEKYTRYFQTPSAKLFLHKILEYVDTHAEEFLSLGCLPVVPKQMMMLVLDRDESVAAEMIKFEAAWRWCKLHHQNHPDIPLKTIFGPFALLIEFHKIPATDLMQKVKPLDLVDDSIIVNALAYQADPESVDITQINSRQMRALSFSTYKQTSIVLSPKRSCSYSAITQRIDMNAIRQESTSNLSRNSEFSQSCNGLDSVRCLDQILEGAASTSLLDRCGMSQSDPEAVNTIQEKTVESPPLTTSPLPAFSTPHILMKPKSSPMMSKKNQDTPMYRTYSDQPMSTAPKTRILILKKTKRNSTDGSMDGLSGSVGILSQVSSTEC